MLLTINRLLTFNSGIDLFFSKNKNLFFIKGICGISYVFLPSKFFYKVVNNTSIQFIFSNYFFFKGFLSHLVTKLNYLNVIFFIKLKIRGLGYKMRQITSSLFFFFLNYTNYFYFFLPFNLIMHVYKKRSILLSSNWQQLKLILSNILLLKKLGPYTLRGFRLVKQIVLLKKRGKKV